LEHYGDILFLKGDKENAVAQWQKAKSAGNQSDKLNRKINEKKYIK
jgi:predicted negative regulator of RcsB-dependent stress response